MKLGALELLALALSAVVVGCSGKPAPLRLEPPTEGLAGDYGAVLDRWTRRSQIYDGLFSVLYVGATFHAPELRRAFLQRFPDAYGRGSEEARRLTLANPDAETHWEFFLGAATSKQRWNDFARADSIWRVSLVADGVEVDAKVRRIPLNANVRVFYPYLTPYTSGYGLEFPLTTVEGKPLITSATRKLELRVSSALGNTSLVWDLGGSDELAAEQQGVGRGAGG